MKLLYLTEKGYSIVLPEKLQTGKWNVYRSVLSSSHTWFNLLFESITKTMLFTMQICTFTSEACEQIF